MDEPGCSMSAPASSSASMSSTSSLLAAQCSGVSWCQVPVAWASRSAPASASADTTWAGLGRWPGASAYRCSGVQELMRLVARPGSAASSARSQATPPPPLESGSKLEGTRIKRGAGILAGRRLTRRLTLRPFCGVFGAFGQGRAEQEQVAVGVDVRELAHLVVSIAWGPALAGAGRVELRAQLVGVLDRDVDPGSGAAGVVIRLEREVQRHAVPLADGEAGLGRRCGRAGRGEREPEPLVMLDRARHVGRRDARRDAEQAPERDVIGPLAGHRAWSFP